MSTNNKNHTQKGFTLVEIAVVAPVVILVIGTFIYAIITMTGDVMAGRAANVLAYNIQDALNRIEADFKISGGYSGTNSFTVQSPQGSDNINASFLTTITTGQRDNKPLIIKSYATNKNPLAADRNIIYKRGTLADCSNSTLVAQNEILMIDIVYFVDASGTLWRRILVPLGYNDGGCVTSQTTLAEPWQQPSCYNYSSNRDYCKTNDEKLVDGLDATNGFQVTYDSTNTNKITVTIKATSTVAGRSITKSGTISAISAN